ncbi:MAG: hypothetical protein ACLFVP_08075 [Candidatus Bathyarchaeia archaeon]
MGKFTYPGTSKTGMASSSASSTSKETASLFLPRYLAKMRGSIDSTRSFASSPITFGLGAVDVTTGAGSGTLIDSLSSKSSSLDRVRRAGPLTPLPAIR